MKIAIIASHSFPIPYPNLHTGDLVILNLAKSLKDMGHDVSLAAPEGTDFEKLIPMKASLGKYPPSSEECETECFHNNNHLFLNQDIVHDFSNTKCIVRNLNNAGFKNTVVTLLGGAWKQDIPPKNLCVWSEAHKDRVLRGATDYENTPTPDLAGPNGMPVKDARVVFGGIDTNFYTPSYDKEDFYLWIGRWHNVRGYELAINLAIKTGINLILAGEHPDNELFESQRAAANHAMELAKGHNNIYFNFLPSDPDHHVAKRKLYRQAVAMLYSVQFHEPFGLSQVEALSCGTPVIGTNFGSIPEIVMDGKTGFVCENNVESFADAISKIKSISPEACRKNATQRFDKRIMAKNYYNKYLEIRSGWSW